MKNKMSILVITISIIMLFLIITPLILQITSNI